MDPLNPFAKTAYCGPALVEAPKLLVTALSVKNGILKMNKQQPVLRPGVKVDNEAARFSAIIRMLLQRVPLFEEIPQQQVNCLVLSVAMLTEKTPKKAWMETNKHPSQEVDSNKQSHT